MFKFPFYGYPYNYNYYRYYNQLTNNNVSNQPTEPTNKEEGKHEDIKNQEKDDQKSSITNSRKISNTTDQAIFEIFGIKLYLDDLIILGVLYFLYQQNVHDEMLYLILFLLLFS